MLSAVDVTCAREKERKRAACDATLTFPECVTKSPHSYTMGTTRDFYSSLRSVGDLTNEKRLRGQRTKVTELMTNMQPCDVQRLLRSRQTSEQIRE